MLAPAHARPRAGDPARPRPGALKTGAVGQWVRRGLGDGPLAVRLEERLDFHDAAPDEVSSEADTLSLTRAVGVLDPLAPMCWEGLNLWPDAIGTTLAALQDPALSGGGSAGASVLHRSIT
ncbi:MAG TPA: hypothetical protein VFE41_33435 [Acetobacteraceae bacterium]|nr:hypothetical protein [Acetobacteraceae bacterium]